MNFNNLKSWPFEEAKRLNQRKILLFWDLFFDCLIVFLAWGPYCGGTITDPGRPGYPGAPGYPGGPLGTPWESLLGTWGPWAPRGHFLVEPLRGKLRKLWIWPPGARGDHFRTFGIFWIFQKFCIFLIFWPQGPIGPPRAPGGVFFYNLF